MDMSITIEQNYCRRLTSWSSNSFNRGKKKNITSSPLQSLYMSNSFDSSLSPIGPRMNARMVRTVHVVIKHCILNGKINFLCSCIFF